MKKYILTGVCCAVLAISAVGIAGCSNSDNNVGAAADGSTIIWTQQDTGIWVTGQGKIAVTPDIAILYLGVEVEAGTVEKAQADAAVAMDAVLNSLKQNGVSENDIQTQYYSINPVYDWSEKGRVLIGYRVSNSVEAKIKDVEETGAVIDSAVRAGGDYIRINNVAFTVDDYSQYQAQARELAVKDASDKAAELAQYSGVELGGATYISEGSFYAPARYDNTFKDAVEAGMPTTPIQPGELEVTLTVQITYSIK